MNIRLKNKLFFIFVKIFGVAGIIVLVAVGYLIHWSTTEIWAATIYGAFIVGYIAAMWQLFRRL